jgi:hypothetical protein
VIGTKAPPYLPGQTRDVAGRSWAQHSKGMRKRHYDQQRRQLE